MFFANPISARKIAMFGHLGAVLGRLGSLLGRLGTVLGRSGSSLGRLRDFLGGLGNPRVPRPPFAIRRSCSLGGVPGRGRGGVKPLPRGKGGSGKKDSWKEGAAKPPVAQRAGGIFV